MAPTGAAARAGAGRVRRRGDRRERGGRAPSASSSATTSAPGPATTTGACTRCSTPDPGGSSSEAQFAARYRADALTGTLTSVVAVRVGNPHGGVVAVSVRARTRLFGTLRETLLVPLVSSGSGPNVRYAGTLLFPGLRPGERLTRIAELAPRATLLARDGTPLAQGP